MKKKWILSVVLAFVLALFMCGCDDSKSTDEEINYEGNLNLVCEENLIFDQYDIDIYVDDEYVGTLEHGKADTFYVTTTDNNPFMKVVNVDDEEVYGEEVIIFDEEATNEFYYEIQCKGSEVKFESIDKEDFDKIMDKQNPDEEDEQTDSKATTEGDSGNKALTIKNCPELKAMLEKKGEFDESYSDFAEKYKGKIIKFNGKIDSLNNHEDYDTRYDILLTVGDYGSSMMGPYFQLEDVGPYDLGLSSIDNVADVFAVGDNVTIKAKVVSFDENSGLLKLDAISLSSR